MVSRLTYNDLTGRSYELFARVEHASGFFLKGYAGLGSISGGTLTDEDFPPAVVPYSNTLSNQGNGTLGYVTVDFGYDVFRAPTYRVGIFAGDNYMAETLNAYGCTQTNANPDICVPAIPPSVLGITEDTGLHSIRLGIAADVLLFDCLRLGGDAAWVPYAVMHSTDTHWLREDIFGPISESATGNGFQAEAFASYQMNSAFSIGAGVRYWYWNVTGNIDLEQAENVADSAGNRARSTSGAMAISPRRRTNSVSTDDRALARRGGCSSTRAKYARPSESKDGLVSNAKPQCVRMMKSVSRPVSPLIG